MVGRATVERLFERASHAFGGLLDILWSLPAAARLNRVALSSIAVLVLASLAFAVSAGGLDVPRAARAVPVAGETGREPSSSTAPTGSASPLSSNPGEEPTAPGLTFEPVGGAPSSSAGD